jgi:TPR repeat protein
LAVTYFRKAADQGNADGQYGLGAMYLKGEGVAKDPFAARRWIKLAADQDHKLAVTAMANAFIAGTMSVTAEERQSEEALRWIRKDADFNSLQSIDALVQAYRIGGFGLAANAAEANRWQAKANELRGIAPGSRKAKKRNKEVTK